MKFWRGVDRVLLILSVPAALLVALLVNGVAGIAAALVAVVIALYNAVYSWKVLTGRRR